MKKIKDMTVDEMIDYLWDSYKVTKANGNLASDLATLRLIESLATRKGEK